MCCDQYRACPNTLTMQISEYTCHTNLADVDNDEQFQYVSFHGFFTNKYYEVVYV